MTNKFNKQFGARLKELRLRAKISQEEFSEAVGVAPQTVSYWENGHNPVTFNKLPLIANALNTPIYRFFVFPDFTENKDYLAVLENMSAKELNAILNVLKLIEALGK